jgi:CII-binding regulator of phage lambda lysogenization HflD
MQQPSLPDDVATRIERALLAIQQQLDHQAITIAQIQDELSAANRREEWYHVQFSQMARILARDLRELRATLICSLVNDGPVSAAAIQKLLRVTSEDGGAQVAKSNPKRN